MKRFVTLLLANMVATTAFAGLNLDPDTFGIYFDLAGNVNTKQTGFSAVNTEMYILLTNPSTQIKGFELAYEIVPHPEMALTFDEDLLRISQTIAGGSFVDLGTSTNPIIGDFRCGYAAPRPAVPAMLMVTWKFRYYGDADLGMMFYLRGVATNASGPSQGYPVIDGGTGIGLRQAGVASGDRLWPCACTVEYCYNCVSVETSSFGSVKSLFR